MIYEKERRYIIPFEDVPSPRAEMPEISVEERMENFVEVETGFPEEVAVQEAKRCLSCRRCLGCALCWAECKPEAIDFDMPDEHVEGEFDEVILTRGQDNLFESFEPELGYGKYADVITDLQFERMLSPTGPTNGLVVSPLDGEVPARIAIVQGHPDGGEDHLLSSLVLGVNESILALHNTQDLEVMLVSPLCQPFRDQSLSDAKKVAGLKIIEGSAWSVEREEEASPLTLKFSEDGENREESVDMVVVLTKPRLSPEIKSWGRKLEQEVAQA
jgi:heterodisulfide reductase subunit A-like polyferredoxin